MTARRRIWTSGLLACLVLVTGAALADNGSLPDARASKSKDAVWSARLLLEQARVERSQKRLDEANAAYGQAVAAAAPKAQLARTTRERDAARTAFQAAQQALPSLVEQARSQGVRPEILKPYRFAAPAPARPPTPAAP